MSRRSIACLSVAALLLTCLSRSARAQSGPVLEPRGHYVVMPPHLRTDLALTPAAALPSWNGSFTYGGTNYTYNMVGAAPSTNTSAAITTYIIPDHRPQRNQDHVRSRARAFQRQFGHDQHAGFAYL